MARNARVACLTLQLQLQLGNGMFNRRDFCHLLPRFLAQAFGGVSALGRFGAAEHISGKATDAFVKAKRLLRSSSLAFLAQREELEKCLSRGAQVAALLQIGAAGPESSSVLLSLCPNSTLFEESLSDFMTLWSPVFPAQLSAFCRAMSKVAERVRRECAWARTALLLFGEGVRTEGRDARRKLPYLTCT